VKLKHVSDKLALCHMEGIKSGQRSEREPQCVDMFVKDAKSSVTLYLHLFVYKTPQHNVYVFSLSGRYIHAEVRCYCSVEVAR
jgi:hypothetical protein